MTWHGTYHSRRVYIVLAAICLNLLCTHPLLIHAQTTKDSTVNLRASDLIPTTEITFAPQSGTFTQGSTFEVPIYLNTKGSSIGAIELHLSFDPRVLSIIKPSSGSSIIGLWIEAPTYNNTDGTATFIGGIPRGITTSSGLITTITFQAKSIGTGSIEVKNTTRVLLGDGVGSPAAFEANQGRYTIVPTAPGSVRVTSDTHPFVDHWYNNINPVFTWTQDEGVSGFSYVFDDKPNTIPDNTVESQATVVSYEDTKNGAKYFHIKALKNGVWGAATHFQVNIDAEPPAEFSPDINYITAAVINRALVSFFTTDTLSGIDHYEVGVIDKSSSAAESPAFFRTESPYQIPFDTIQHARVIVRAFDRAGNVRDASIDVSLPFLPSKFIVDHATLLLFIALLVMILGILGHYFYGHQVMKHLKTIWSVITNRTKLEQLEKSEKQSDDTGTPSI